jgi:deazaflavin-dependent oxidoreductase (nitroreductase family)
MTQRDWNAQNRQVIAEFRANNGRVGGYFAGKPLLLLTTVGARSGQRRINPLGYRPDGERYIVFGTVAGSPRHPDWYYNVLAHPRVEVELADEAFSATAMPLRGPERQRLCAEHAAQYPDWGRYLSKTSREVPVVALYRSAG